MNLGVVISLRDAFTPVANRIQSSYQALDQSFSQGADSFSGQIGKAMYNTWNGAALAMKGAAVMLPVVFSVKEAMAYEYQMKAIQTIWEHNTESAEVQTAKIKELSAAIMDMSTNIGTDPTQTAAAYYDVIQANIQDTTEALHTLELAQKSAIGGLTTPEVAAKGLVSLKNAYNLSNDEMTETADHLFQALAAGAMTFEEFNRSIGVTIGTVREGGLSLKEFYANVATFTLSGGTASEGMTGMKQTLKSLSKRKLKSTEEMFQGWIKEGWVPEDFDFGITYMNKIGFNKFLQMVTNAAHKTDDFNDSMQKMFVDIQAKNFVFAVTGSQMEKYNDVFAQLENSAGALDRAFNKMHESVTERVKALGYAFNRLKIAVGTPFLAVIGIIVKGLTIFVSNLALLFQRVPALAWAFAILTTSIALLFITLGSALIVLGLVKVALIGLQWIAGGAALATGSAFRGMAIGMARLIPFLGLLAGAAYILKQAWDGNWGGMRDSLNKFWDNTKLVGDGLMQLIRSTKGGLGEMSYETAKALQDAGLLDFVVTIYMWWYRLSNFWDGFKSGFVAAWKSFMNGIKSLFESTNPVLRAAGEAIMWVVDKLGLLRPAANTAEQWRNAGESVGKFVFHLLGFILAMKSFSIIANGFRTLGSIVHFLLGPLRGLWGLLKLFASGITINVAPWISEFMGLARVAGIRAAFSDLFATIALKALYFKDAILGIARAIGSGFGGVGRVFMTVISWLLRIGRTIALVTSLISFIVGIPVWAIALIVAAVAVGIALIIKYWDKIKPFFAGLWGWISNAAGVAWDWISDKAGSAWGTIKSVWASAKSNLTGIWHFIRGAAIIAWYHISAAAIGAWGKIKGAWNGVLGFWKGVWNGAKIMARSAWSNIKALWTGFADWFTSSVWGPVKAGAKAVWNTVKAGARAAWGGIKIVWGAVSGWFSANVWGPFKAVAQAAWNIIKPYAQSAWDGLVAVWGVLSSWWSANISEPISTAWSATIDFAIAAGQGMWNGITSALSGIGAWFYDTVVAPLMAGWNNLLDFFGSVGAKIGSGIDYVQNVGKTGEYKDKNYGPSKVGKTPKNVPGNKAVPQMATGGYIKPGASGLAFLDPNELVINSDTYNKLQQFLSKPSDHIKGDDPEAPPKHGDKLATYARREEAPKGDFGDIAAQLAQLAQAMAGLSERPIHTTVKMNGKTIATAVNDHNRSEDARRY